MPASLKEMLDISNTIAFMDRSTKDLYLPSPKYLDTLSLAIFDFRMVSPFTSHATVNSLQEFGALQCILDELPASAVYSPWRQRELKKSLL